MTKHKRQEKLAVSVFAAVVLAVAVGLELAGSFVPFWATPANTTIGDIRYSLWTTDTCFDYVCETTYKTIKRIVTDCDLDGKCSTYAPKIVVTPITNCYKTDFCNKTWHHIEDPSNVPSILFVGMAFETPAVVFGFIALLIYVVKIILNIRQHIKRLHLKAAYLTFSAISGAAAEFGVIIFCVMLEQEKLNLGWAPALCGVGGFLQLSIALGGYLGWRSVSTDAFDEDDDDLSLTEKMADKTTHERPPHGKKKSKFSFPWS